MRTTALIVVAVFAASCGGKKQSDDDGGTRTYELSGVKFTITWPKGWKKVQETSEIYWQSPLKQKVGISVRSCGSDPSTGRDCWVTFFEPHHADAIEKGQHSGERGWIVFPQPTGNIEGASLTLAKKVDSVVYCRMDVAPENQDLLAEARKVCETIVVQ
jgi:hypothetical protein